MNKARQHPAGIAGLLAPAAVIIANKLNLDLSVDEAVILIGAVVGVVSLINPLPKTVTGAE